MGPIVKIIFSIIALTTTLTLTLTLTLILSTTTSTTTPPPENPPPSTIPAFPGAAKRTSRFLQQNGNQRNPKAADHCNKDREICGIIMNGKNATCCNNKCVDLGYDDNNCGACKSKCLFTETCCRGECVDLAYDKRHCGGCNHRCMPGGYCIYGLCDYA